MIRRLVKVIIIIVVVVVLLAIVVSRIFLRSLNSDDSNIEDRIQKLQLEGETQ